MTLRILLCITVYNGRAFVPQTLASAMRLDSASADVDVFVLDDCSPDPGFSDELAGLCSELGISYYRSPRNLGIPRNVNLGLLSAVRGGYDHVMICNSDVLFPSNLLDGMLAAADNDNVGSVTAWSNNVSVYSIPNEDPNTNLADQDVVDWLSASIAGNFRGAVMDIPAGISFCILIPVAVLREVGLMDPVFGRGYCEETDWTLRSRSAGYRICLAPGVFVYHAGGGTNRDAGLLEEGMTTVPHNEAVIDMRFPQFRSQVDAFFSSKILQTAHRDAIHRIVCDAGSQFGYTLEVGWLPRVTKDDSEVRCIVAPDASGKVQLRFRGFEFSVDAPDDVSAFVRELFGREPSSVNVYDRGPAARLLRDQVGTGVSEMHSYPTRV